LFDYVVQTLQKAFKTDKIALFFKQDFNAMNSTFKLYASLGLNNSEVEQVVNNTKIVHWLKINKKPFLLDRAYQVLSKREYAELSHGLTEVDALLVVPFIYKDGLIGFITLGQKRSESHVFDINDIELLQSLANQVSIAVENAVLYRELDDAYTNIARSLSIAVESKEGYTVGHSDNVMKYAVALAKKLGMPAQDVQVIAHAAMLHDIGKIAVPDAILNKPDKLTEKEWDEIKTHSMKGAKILEPLPYMKEVIQIIKHHHEWYNGTGYPDKLKSDQIPAGAQIMAIADSFDAMVSYRPYREANGHRYTFEKAVQELVDNRGTQFNPLLVDVFVQLLNENPNIVRI
jgi:putative nucleotidyltransferase with HDIG domain